MTWQTRLVILLGMLTLAACSTASDTVPPAAPSAGSGPTEGIGAQPTAEPAAETPKLESGSSPPRGGKLVRVFRDPPTLDPHLTTDTSSATIIVEVFGGLVTIDRDLQIVPDLAENWDVSSDGRGYSFHIRPEARFHDGRPVTAADVQWSMERVADPATQSSVASQYLGDIVGLTHISHMAKKSQSNS